MKQAQISYKGINHAYRRVVRAEADMEFPENQDHKLIARHKFTAASIILLRYGALANVARGKCQVFKQLKGILVFVGVVQK